MLTPDSFCAVNKILGDGMKKKCTECGHMVDFTVAFPLPKDGRTGYACPHCGALYGIKGNRITTKQGAKAYYERSCGVFYKKKDGTFLL